MNTQNIGSNGFESISVFVLENKTSKSMVSDIYVRRPVYRKGHAGVVISCKSRIFYLDL